MIRIPNAKRVLDRVLTTLEELLGQAANLFLFVIMACITGGAIARYIFNSPLNSIDQLVTIYFGPAVVLLGATATLRENEHISVSFVFDRLAAKAKLACHVLACLMGIVIFGVIGYQGYLHARDALVEGQRLVGVIDLPMFPPYVMVPVASAMLVLRLAVMLFSGPSEMAERAGYVEGQDAERMGS